MWTLEAKLQELMNCSSIVSENLIRLLDKEENTPTFVSRYRKNETENMTPEQVFESAKNIKELKEIQKKQKSLLNTLEKEKKLTADIKREIEIIDNIDDLNETIAVYKTAKTSVLKKAVEAGAEEAFEEILEMCRFGSVNLQRMKSAFNRKNKNFLKYIPLIAIPRLLPELSKQLSLDLHNILLKAAKSKSKACKNQEKYANYFSFSRNLQELADHQFLAVLRGDKEKALSTSLTIVGNPWNVRNSIASGVIAQTFGKAILAEKQLSKAIMEGLLDKFSSMELRRLKALRKKRAEDGSCSVFRSNLKALLLQTPLKARNIIAIDPGFANGCKCAVIDKNGKPLKFRKLFLRKKDEFTKTLEGFVSDFNVDIIGVGDGQGSREAEAIVASLVAKLEQRGINSSIRFCTVREAGVSVYSCSPIAAKEFPDLEPAERSAISLARRLLDPMTELVKVSPENLGVGQYQHDINAKKLSEALDDAVEQSVSFVGVDLNTAGEHLLARVAGIGPARAKKIVSHRDKNKEFKNIDGIKEVKGFGAKSFKQAAGFLRVYGGDNKLDQTWIHPESYHLAKKVLRKLKMKIEDIGSDRLNSAALKVTPDDFDIEKETAKMIIDAFRNSEEDVRNGKDVALRTKLIQLGELKVGEVFKGVVSNTTTFGCFVNIGLQRDGLIHNSKMRGQTLAPNQPVTVRIEEIKGEKLGLRLIETTT